MGAIRPISSRDVYQLNRALVSCDAVAALLENAVRYPLSVTEDRLEILAFNLREAADAIDPAIVKDKLAQQLAAHLAPLAPSFDEGAQS
jgi:hypothetical protein